MFRSLSVPFIAIVFLSLSACHFYKEYDKDSFPTYSWNDGQDVVFTPTIEDPSKRYRITLGLRHHYGFQSSGFGVNVKMVSPSGKESASDYELKIRDVSNKPIGSCAGDLCDLETVIIDDFMFAEAGEYKILVRHNESGYRIAGIIEVGLVIDEVD